MMSRVHVISDSLDFHQAEAVMLHRKFWERQDAGHKSMVSSKSQQEQNVDKQTSLCAVETHPLVLNTRALRFRHFYIYFLFHLNNLLNFSTILMLIFSCVFHRTVLTNHAPCFNVAASTNMCLPGSVGDSPCSDMRTFSSRHSSSASPHSPQSVYEGNFHN